MVILIAGDVTVSSAEMKIRTESNNIKLPSIEDVPRDSWAKLAGKKIFFGHQSVGYNIVDGITDIIKEREYIKLDIAETRGPAGFDKPVFAHAQVGRNTDPTSKIESFRKVMDTGVGGKVDIAFFKFCYVDIMRDSDPQEILDSYSAVINDLKDRYPETRFLHVTVPVCSPSKGFKRNIKQSIRLLIGKPGVLDDNIMRQRYNELLKEAYSKIEPVFDLALAETIKPDGFECYVAKGMEKVYVMAREYTDDGGHLNSRGRKKVAEQLLITLASSLK